MRKFFLSLYLALQTCFCLAQTTIQQAEDYIKKGIALDAEDKIQMAIGMYTKAIQLDARSSKAYLNRGNDFISISRYPQAIADYDRVISLSPQNSEAYNMRGIANYRLEQYDLAAADYSKAISLGHFMALVNRGVLYLDQGKTEQAKADFNKAIAMQPDAAGDAYFNLADVLLTEQQYDAALANIEKAVSINPGSPLYQSLYAKTLLTFKRDQEALNAAEKILSLDSKNRDGFIYKASALSNLKRFDDAITVISEGIKQYPDFFLMYSLRGFIYKMMGKTALADADDAKAKELGTAN